MRISNKHRLQRAVFGFGQVALGLLGQDAQQVDGLLRAR